METVKKDQETRFMPLMVCRECVKRNPTIGKCDACRAEEAKLPTCKYCRAPKLKDGLCNCI